MGLIYMCISPDGKMYIGQHNTNEFRFRKRTHEYRYFEFLKRKCIIELNKKFYPERTFPPNPRGFCTSLYCAFQKHGFINFTWKILVTDVSKENLNIVEDKYILNNN